MVISELKLALRINFPNILKTYCAIIIYFCSLKIIDINKGYILFGTSMIRNN